MLQIVSSDLCIFCNGQVEIDLKSQSTAVQLLKQSNRYLFFGLICNELKIKEISVCIFIDQFFSGKEVTLRLIGRNKNLGNCSVHQRTTF